MQLSLIISRWLALYRSVAGWGRNESKKSKNAPTIIFSLPDGRKLTAGELQGASGRVAFRDGELLDVTSWFDTRLLARVPCPRWPNHCISRRGKQAGAVITSKQSRSWRGHRNSHRSGLIPYMTERTLICLCATSKVPERTAEGPWNCRHADFSLQLQP
jgi:hypothetical protein